MDGQVLKSFLVGLGFGVDDTSLAKFNKSIASATLRVAALYGSVKATTAGVAFGISKISESFEALGYEYKIIAPAINKALILRQEMLKAYRAAGVNLTSVVHASLKLNMSLTKTRYAFEALYKSVASRFFGLLTRQSDIFRKKLYDNMPKIQDMLERFVKFLFQGFDAVSQLGARLWSILSRVYDILVQLHQTTAGWSTAILAAVAAWKILNLGFLATPLGMLLAGFTALLALWDDLKTFKEGGQALINWGSEATQMIVGLTAVIGGLVAGVWSVVLATKAWALAQGLVNTLFALSPLGLIITGLTALLAVLTYVDAKWQLFGGHISSFFSGIGGKVLDFLGGANVAANVAATAPNGVPVAAPLGSNAANNLSNQNNINQQTNINIATVADAQSTGKAVSWEQYKVNQDLVRNMKGATTPTAVGQ